MNDDDARMMGARLRQIRDSRKKSLRVLAGLTGMSKLQLSQIERGERALDSLKQLVALAKVLQIASSELTALPVGYQQPDGQMPAVEALRARVETLMTAHYRCDRDDEVSATLLGLIRDLHTSIAVGRDVAELSALAVVLHSGAALGWLRLAGAPLDLRS